MGDSRDGLRWWSGEEGDGRRGGERAANWKS